jgi:hypothetical protein
MGGIHEEAVMPDMNEFDLITQRVLALHVRNVEEQLRLTTAELEQAKERIAELEAPPAKTSE